MTARDPTPDEVAFLADQGFSYRVRQLNPNWSNALFYRDDSRGREIICEQRYGNQWRCWRVELDWNGEGQWAWGSRRYQGGVDDPALFKTAVAAFVYAETEEWGR